MKCLAYRTEINAAYGIYYQDFNHNLFIRLLFKEESKALDFEGSVLGIPRLYRKRKPEDNTILPDVSVCDNQVRPVLLPDQLVRVYESDYVKIANDLDQSDDCDTEFGPHTSVASPVLLSEETRLRLVDREDSTWMFGQNAEKCHFLSQSKFPNDKYDPNNIVFMSRLMHHHFDGIKVFRHF